MKKLPILLLALTVGMMTPIQVAYAAREREQRITDDVADEGMEQRKTTELPVLNKLEPMLIFRSIKPRDGLIDFEIASPTGKEWRIQRVWLAAFDYEGGWTEVEVDEQLSAWTELEADWAKATKEQSLTNMALWSFATVAFTIDKSTLRYDLTTMNLPDILYYAVEFKDEKGEEEGPIWVRGKIDYRGCAHARSFLEGETETCVAQVDEQSGTVKYWPSEAQEDEEVVTWEEEWRLVLAERLAEVEVELDRLVPEELLPESLEWVLGQQEDKLTAIEELLAKATGVNEEVKGAERLREKIAALRKTGSEIDTGAGPEAGSGSGSGVGVGSGTSSGAGVGTGTGADEGSNGDGSGVEGSLGENANGLGALEAEDGGYRDTMIGAGDVDLIEDGAGMENTIGVAVLAEDAEEVSATDASETEVPKLGGAKAERNWLWWVTGMAAVLSLFFVVVLKRKQGKDRQR